MFDFVFLSEQGERERQEDFYAQAGENFFVLADGLGGMPYGHIASRLAARSAVVAYNSTFSSEKQENVSHMVMEYIKTVQDTPVLTEKEEKLLLEKAAKGDKKARDKLVEGNLKLVISIAQKYADRGVPLPDLVQEGNVGLYRAVEKYDFTRVGRFSTHAARWIGQAIEKAIKEQGRRLVVSPDIVEKVGKVSDVRRVFKREFRREPTTEELEEEVDLTSDEIEEVMRIIKEVGTEKPRLRLSSKGARMEDLERIFNVVNQVVYDMAQKRQFKGMGTTLAAVLIKEEEALFGNVGDSRGYLFSAGDLSQVTEDHREGPYLTQAIGTDEEVRSGVYKLEVGKEDIVLLCTDGLTDYVQDSVIAKILSGKGELKDKATGLINAALQFGSTDNITVGLIEI